MPTASRTCPAPGCGELIPRGRRRCALHQAEHERRRGNRQQRGYDADHDVLRAHWAPIVATGTVRCWRCREHISPAEPWHLGHDDDDRSIHRGPEHVTCNTAAGGRSAHRRPGGCP